MSSSPSGALPDLLPDLNTLLRLAVGRSGDPADGLRALDVPSRVEAVDRTSSAPRVLVATPCRPGDGEDPPAGTACTLTWTVADRVRMLPAGFATTVRDDVLRLWWLTVTGAAVPVQRRAYFRCPLQLPVRLVPGGRGRSVDLGESGARCIVQGAPLPVGTAVDVELGTDDGPAAGGAVLALTGTVLRAQRAARAPDHADTAVAFEAPEGTRDAVRRLLFAEQLRLRRRGML